MNNRMRLSFGIKTLPQHTTYDEILSVWREADTIPVIEHAWLWDHLLPLRGDPNGPILEGWTLLAALAAQTQRLRLGLMVTNNLNRYPAVLAKIAATTDVIARGRLDFGIGAGPNERMAQEWRAGGHTLDADAYGIPLPATAGESVARLAEVCSIIRRMWSEDAFDFAGRYYNLIGARCAPKPVQRPHPPILIGGWGERKMLRVVAEHADIWNMPDPPHSTVAEFRHKSRVLDEHCAAIGRDPAAIIRSVQTAVQYDEPATTRDLLLELIDAGARHLVLGLPQPYPPDVIHWVADQIVAPVIAQYSGA